MLGAIFKKAPTPWTYRALQRGVMVNGQQNFSAAFGADEEGLARVVGSFSERTAEVYRNAARLYNGEEGVTAFNARYQK